MEFVDQPRLKILAHRRGAAADAYVPAASGLARAFERLPDSAGDEVEDGAALDRDRIARMVGEHEDRHAIGRLLAPPALPAVVGPWPAARREHVAAHDPGAEIFEAARREMLVDAIAAALLAVHRAEGGRVEHPFVQRLAAAPQRIGEALVRPGAEAVDRDAVGGNTDFH